MRSYEFVALPARGALSAGLLICAALLSPAFANDKSPGAATCTCPGAGEPDATRPPMRPRFAEIRPSTSAAASVAALEAVHLALTEVGDGSAYVWHHNGSELSGVVRPTYSFRDARGLICRHLQVVLSADGRTRSTESVACRSENGLWQVGG